MPKKSFVRPRRRRKKYQPPAKRAKEGSETALDIPVDKKGWVLPKDVTANSYDWASMGSSARYGDGSGNQARKIIKPRPEEDPKPSISKKISSINREPRPEETPDPSVSSTQYLAGVDKNTPVDQGLPEVVGTKDKVTAANFLARTKPIDLAGGTITPEIKAEMKAAGMGFSGPPPLAPAIKEPEAKKDTWGRFAAARKKNQDAMTKWKEAQNVHKTREKESRKSNKQTLSYKQQLEKQRSDYEDQWAGKKFGTSMKETFRAEVAERKRINEEKKKKKAADKADKKEVKVAANNPNNA
tara:strand:- start:471 stop:1364 length:894 start_codon:yes stop_codon:yes gene_type:complete